MEIEQIDIATAASDETGYIINGTQKCLVRFGRAPGAAASAFSVFSAAFAVDADGLPLISDAGNVIEGASSHSVLKTSLLTDGVFDSSKAAAVKQTALEGAVADMLGEIAVEQANSQIKI